MFYKFIWNGGNDRVHRACIRNNYNDCGLHMIDAYSPKAKHKNDMGQIIARW